MVEQRPSLDVAVREVTDAEVAAYRENGWALLHGFVDTGAVAAILERLRAALGETGVEGTARAAPEGQTRPAYYDTLFRNWLQPWREDADLAAFATSPGMGAAAARLMGARHGVRLWMDEGLVKLPAAGGGGPTPWHQDGPTFPFDRSGWLTFWIALVDVPPDMGSLRFYSGSHRSGFHGRVLTPDGADVFTDRPELRGEFALSPPLTLRPGDATVHGGATIHGAPPNDSDRPRWSYSCAYFPGDARYTGATQRLTDGLDLPPNGHFDHPHFPLVHPPTAPG
jgi:ectoine hydroxylase-related dioxygenase (phytanoyl-CoA dioxygenase family)